MKKTLLAIIALALIAGTASAVDLIADGGDPLTAIDVGEVTVTNDGTDLTVIFTIDTGDWKFVETHLHVATDAADIPQTKKHNPKPGKFDYNQSDAAINVDATEHVYTIPLADIGVGLGDDIVIAAHAAIEYVQVVGLPDDEDPEDPPADPDILYEESAWGEGHEFADDRNWAMYFEY